jgi:hypothetical protein
VEAPLFPPVGFNIKNTIAIPAAAAIQKTGDFFFTGGKTSSSFLYAGLLDTGILEQAVPQTPQNFIFSCSSAPQPLQTLLCGKKVFPHVPQNLAFSGDSVLQVPQIFPFGIQTLPHAPQNFAFSDISNPQV